MNLTEHFLENWHYYERLLKALSVNSVDERMAEIMLKLKIYDFKTYSESACRNFILNYIN